MMSNDVVSKKSVVTARPYAPESDSELRKMSTTAATATYSSMLTAGR